jgi:hypothetical protein
MMRVFELEISKRLAAGKPNALAVEVFAPDKTDLAMTWVDWNPTPPDKDMGLWKDLYLTTTGAVRLRHPFVESKLEPGYAAASLTITADLRNAAAHSIASIVHAEIDGIQVSQKVELAAFGIKNGCLCARSVSATAHRSSPAVVAVSDGQTRNVHGATAGRSGWTSLRFDERAVWHP